MYDNEDEYIMPAQQTLISHLPPRLTDRIEDIAVETLGCILSKSPASRQPLQSTTKNQ